MKILGITDIIKKDIPLHYRNEYTGTVDFDLMTTKQRKKVTFTVERSAVGSLDISINLLEDIDYPLIPVLKTLKQHIMEMEKEGLLPW